MSYTPEAKRYDTMKYRRCGKSGLMLPAVSLGLWHNFGEVNDRENAFRILRTSFDLGITHFDIANNYGPPPRAAEECFGDILKKDFYGLRDEMIISTKAGYRCGEGPYADWASKKYLTASLDKSLQCLGLDYVDIFYSHRPDPNTPVEETAEALALMVRQGKALYVGISSYKPAETRAMAEALRAWNVRVLIHQPRYSMFDRWVEGGLLDTLDELGIGSIAYTPLAQGLLTDKYLGGVIPDGSRASTKTGFLKPEHITDDKINRAAKLNDIAASRGQSLAQLALAWVLRGERVTSALIGASRPEQVIENVRALERLSFDASELAAIASILG